MQTTLKVTGMHCGGCENKIQKVVGRMDSVQNVHADRNAEQVDLEYDGSEEVLNSVKSKIVDLGYQVVG